MFSGSPKIIPFRLPRKQKIAKTNLIPFEIGMKMNHAPVLFLCTFFGILNDFLEKILDKFESCNKIAILWREV